MAYDFDPDLRGTIRSHRDQISEVLLQRSECNDNVCDKVFEQHRMAMGNLREIEAGIAVLSRLKTVEEERRDRSLQVWPFGESDCISYAPPQYGASPMEIKELRHQIRLMIGFLQAQDQELSSEEDPIREGPRIRGDAPTIDDYIRASGFPPDGW